MFICLLFISFCFSSVDALYKTSNFSGKCSNENIPVSATSIYEVDDGIFNLSGTTYGNYLSMHKDDNEKGGYSNYLLDNNYVYYSTSKDKKTLIAYVPNYSTLIKDKDALEVLKLEGLYDKNNLNCNGTYVSYATAVFYEDSSLEDENEFILNKHILPFLTYKNLIIILIVSLSIVIIILVLSNHKNISKKRMIIYLLIIFALILSAMILTFSNSFALNGSLNKVTNLKLISNTSTSSRIGFSKVNKADNYDVCYKKSSSNNYTCKNTTSNSIVINNLDSDTYYNYKVRAKSSSLIGPYSNVLTVKTYKKDGYYYYLNSNQKTVYNEIYSGIKNRKKMVNVTPYLSIKDFGTVYHYVRADHPELFYMDVGYYYFYDNNNHVGGFEKYYNSTFNDYATNKRKFDKAVNNIVNKAKGYKSDYEKEQFVAYYLSKNVKYDYKAYNKYKKTNKWTDSLALTQSSYSALVNKKTFCAGYSSAFKYIMDTLNIDSYVIGGVGKRFGSSGEHAWNLVKLDDGYYNLDITWIRKKSGGINLTYFNQKKSSFNSGHLRDKSDRVAPSAEGVLYLNFNGNNVINLKNNDSIILKGKSKKLKVKVDRKYTKKSKLKYKSSNSKIIKVSRRGKIKALRVGTATIKVYTKDGIKASKKISVKNKVVCAKLGKTYYGKKGKKVRLSVYYKQCNPKCSIKTNVYYNNVGKPVSRDSYYSVCSGKCVSSGNRYYDKNGNMTSKTSFYKSCNPSCKKVGDNYYDINGKPSSYEDYSVSCYSKNGNFEVTFDSFGKDRSTESIRAGSVVQKPNTPSKRGYNFIGWYEDENYSKEYDFNSSVYDNITLYAKWEKEEFNVKFNSNGGSIIKDEKVLYNDEASKPLDPVKNNYIFGGWYKDEEFKTKYSFLTPVTKDLVLYAKWNTEEDNKVSITYVPGGSHEPFVVEIDKGSKLEASIVSSNDDLVFDKWYLDSKKTEEYNFDDLVYEDMVLYGKWKTKDGNDALFVPDTSSKAQMIIIVIGIVFVFIGLYYGIRKYDIKK